MEKLADGTLKLTYPPKIRRTLLEAHETEADFIKRVFAKKETRTIYTRTRIDIEQLWYVPSKEESKKEDIIRIGRHCKKENIIEPESNPMVENFIMNFD